jgi:3-oxoacyl-(acyl-carrier-protein) synthase
MYRTDLSSRSAEKVNAAKRSNIMHLLIQNQKEQRILKNYYETGHTAEIIAYGMEQFDVTIRYLLKYYTVSIQTASDVAAEAIEQFCERIISGKASTLYITGYIRSLSRQIISNRNKTIKYDSTNNESGRGVHGVRP